VSKFLCTAPGKKNGHGQRAFWIDPEKTRDGHAKLVEGNTRTGNAKAVCEKKEKRGGKRWKKCIFRYLLVYNKEKNS